MALCFTHASKALKSQPGQSSTSVVDVMLPNSDKDTLVPKQKGNEDNNKFLVIDESIVGDERK